MPDKFKVAYSSQLVYAALANVREALITEVTYGFDREISAQLTAAIEVLEKLARDRCWKPLGKLVTHNERLIDKEQYEADAVNALVGFERP